MGQAICAWHTAGAVPAVVREDSLGDVSVAGTEQTSMCNFLLIIFCTDLMKCRF